MKVFIIRPTVLNQLRYEAGYPVWTNDTQIERELRRALDSSSKTFYGRLRNMRVFRINTPGRKTVYAVGRPISADGRYDMQIVAIKSMRAYYSSEVYMRYTPNWGAKRHYSDKYKHVRIN